MPVRTTRGESVILSLKQIDTPSLQISKYFVKREFFKKLKLELESSAITSC